MPAASRVPVPERRLQPAGAMAPRISRLLVWLNLLGLLLPATLLTGLLLVVGLPAVAQRSLSGPQLAFDMGFALIVAGLAAGWRLSARDLRAGTRLPPAWRATLVLAAILGLGAGVILAAHLLGWLEPGVVVGFALLSPGALLLPLVLARAWR